MAAPAEHPAANFEIFEICFRMHLDGTPKKPAEVIKRRFVPPTDGMPIAKEKTGSRRRL
jgi:hypothetical protein